MAQPTITSICPNYGPTAGQQGILINGSGFDVHTAVLFDGIPATSISIESPTALTVVTPAHVASVVDVVISNPGYAPTTLHSGYAYLEQYSELAEFESEAQNRRPVAIIAPATQRAPVGGMVRLDGRSSVDPMGRGLVYLWSFREIPIGSLVEESGFARLESDGSVVTFVPDVAGHYQVSLVVTDETLSSPPAYSEVDCQVVLVPYSRGIVPDAGFIWRYLSDFWKLVEGRKRFEIFWSAAIQAIAAEYLKLYQFDYDKSIQDIQEQVQRRWQYFTSWIDLSSAKTRVILADDQAGAHALTSVIDPVTGWIAPQQPAFSNFVGIPITDGNFSRTLSGQTIPPGRVVSIAGRGYTESRSGGFTVNGPPNAAYSSFFSDLAQIPTGLSNEPWRFSSTLISDEYNFEGMGCSPGDVLVVQVSRTDTRAVTELSFQIVSVDRNRLGFVFNTEELLEGVAAGGLSEQDQLALATALNIDGLVVGPQGDYLYSGTALEMKAILSSDVFKRTIFEKELPSDVVLTVAGIPISVKPLRVVRNKQISISSLIRSIPCLQEYVKQPELVQQGGKLYQVSENKLYELSHTPHILFGNRDYVVDDYLALEGNGSILAGSDILTIPHGDLVDRNVRPGDVVNMYLLGAKFTIVRVLDSERVKVTPAPTANLALEKLKLERRISGVFIRFVDDVFTKRLPAPKRLWAEVVFVDNNTTVENNFGALVGVTQKDLAQAGSTTSYKSAVAGLMYAMTNGPTLANMELASQVFLGLPFAQHPGIITSINPIYLIWPDGSPQYGRVTVQAQDGHGNDIGITDVYVYFQGKQTADPEKPNVWWPVLPDLSGLAINPTTGEEYKVGDRVERYASISKCTKAVDYVRDAEFKVNDLSRYHTVAIISNSEVVDLIDQELMISFLKQARATYTRLRFGLTRSDRDNVLIEDDLSLSRPVTLSDTPYLGLPTSLAFDSYEESFLLVEGDMFRWLLSGGDLVTTEGQLAISSSSGGFVNTSTVHDLDSIRPEDLVKIETGWNTGLYLVGTVDSDSTITLLPTDRAGQVIYLRSRQNQAFSVYRRVKPFVDNVSGALVQGDAWISVYNSIFGSGVCPGDVALVTSNGVTSWHRVIDVDLTQGSERVYVSPPPSVTASGVVTFCREGLLTKALQPGLTSPALQAHLTVIGNWASSQDLFPPLGVLQPGDILEDISSRMEHQILDVDLSASRFYLYPAPTAGDRTFNVAPRGRADTIISLDLLTRLPEEFLRLELTGDDLQTSEGSATVTTISGVDFSDLGIQRGDFLVIKTGDDTLRDIGFGAGVFPIADIAIGGVSLTLTRPLTVSVSPASYGIQRRRPNGR